MLKIIRRFAKYIPFMAATTADVVSGYKRAAARLEQIQEIHVEKYDALAVKRDALEAEMAAAAQEAALALKQKAVFANIAG